MKKVLISGSSDPIGYPMSIKNGLIDAGDIDVRIFSDSEEFINQYSFLQNRYFYRVFWKFFVKSFEQKFLLEVNSFLPDFILVIKGFYFTPKTYIEIKKINKNIKLLYFNPDNPLNNWHFGNSNQSILNSIIYFDVVLSWGLFLKESYIRLGAKQVEHLMFAYDEKVYIEKNSTKFKALNTKFISDISFIGSWDEERENWIKDLGDLNIKIWGNGWEKSCKAVKDKWQGMPAEGSFFREVVIKSRINLNFVRKQNVPSHNMRTFEIFGLGGFMLSTYCSELDDIFPNNQMTSFIDKDELINKIEYFLLNEVERSRIVFENQNIILNDHTYTHRSKQLKQIMLNM